MVFLMGLRYLSDKVSSFLVTSVLCQVFYQCFRGDGDDIPIARPARYSVTSHVTPVSQMAPPAFIFPPFCPGNSLYLSGVDVCKEFKSFSKMSAGSCLYLTKS